MLQRIFCKASRLLAHALHPRELLRRRQVDQVCIGYSHLGHWLSFRTMLRHFRPRSAAILGVYYGRDIAYLKSLQPDLTIVGVDRFADVPGEDWPANARQLGWEAAGFGSPPALTAARHNLQRLGVEHGVTLIQGEALDFLKSTEQFFDLIYIDVSHDYQTTMDLLVAACPRLSPQGILAGDDFSNQGTWGVEKAVREFFQNQSFVVFRGNIWLVQPARSGLPYFSRLLR